MLNELTAEYPTAPKNKLETVLSCAYALASPESNELGLHNFPIENIPIVAKLIVSKIYCFNVGTYSLLFYYILVYVSFLDFD